MKKQYKHDWIKIKDIILEGDIIIHDKTCENHNEPDMDIKLAHRITDISNPNNIRVSEMGRPGISTGLNLYRNDITVAEKPFINWIFAFTIWLVILPFQCYRTVGTELSRRISSATKINSKTK